jgi:L-serine dehydratase
VLVKETAEKKNYNFGHMTIGQCIELATELNMSVGNVILEETMEYTGKTYDQVMEDMNAAFAHNIMAAEIGLTTGRSGLLGEIGKDLNSGDIKIIDDSFVNRVIVITLAAQVGNHIVGLRPCAGTGDSCPYTGFVKTVKEFYPDDIYLQSRIMAVILKIGGMYRIGKCTTGCNMEGLGAGASATSAAFVELAGGTAAQMEKAIVLAISPTIAVPCTPRVLVPGLCATHIGGGVMIARLASQLAMYTSIPSTVPVDVMIAMAAQCHLQSAEHVVPVTIQYMEPFFKRDPKVEEFVDMKLRQDEFDRKDQVIAKASSEAVSLADRSNLITSPFGDAVVGGSSEGVGSPTNCGRLAHYLSKGEIKKVRIELCEELFARRATNIPGILMAAVNGCSTSDAEGYKKIMDEVMSKGIEVEIIPMKEPHVQRVFIEATEKNSFVDTLNRAGARLVLLDASAPKEEVLELAKKLNIVVIDR